MPTASEAHLFAANAHSGQMDQGGKPYIRHINRVAAAADARARHARLTDGLKVNPAAVLQAAYLHDVLEDTETTADALRQAGFAESVITMVELLTKTEEALSYAERISALIQSGNLGAILIRMSDNEDNANAARTLPAGGTLSMRYAASLPRLKDAAAALGYTGS